MKDSRPIRWLLYAALPIAYLLHNDLWWWYDPRLTLGLPVGLTYHIGFNIVISILMLLLVRCAWPSHLRHPGDSEEKEE
ncbi:MAG: hypothetical protein ACE5HV_05880 [Acidobacteriota bacterium]